MQYSKNERIQCLFKSRTICAVENRYFCISSLTTLQKIDNFTSDAKYVKRKNAKILWDQTISKKDQDPNILKFL